MTRDENILEFRNISKTFGTVRALDDVSFTVKRGEVHALVGENGAGKSTLMKILMGLHTQYEGTVLLRQEPLAHRGVREAIAHGVSMIHQELTYVPSMTVAENLFLGNEPASGILKRINDRLIRESAAGLLQNMGMDLDVERKMKDLSVAERQMVEIAKAISYDADVVIMDEPTSAISQHQVQALFEIIDDLKSRGVTIVYISHKLDEVLQIADAATVLRDGRHIATLSQDHLHHDRLVAMMVGRAMSDVAPTCRSQPGREVLTVTGLTKKGLCEDVTFQVRAGEIVGLAGLMGAGRSEVLRCLFGLDRYDQGRISIHGRDVKIRCPADAMRYGMSWVGEDRQISGPVGCLSVQDNVTLSSLGHCASGPMIRRKTQYALANQMIDRLSIKTPSIQEKACRLSGGNQQKVVLARALLTQPAVLILDEPTRGIDVGAKAQIHHLIRQLTDEGKAILMASSELPEVLALCHRIIVLREGRVTARLLREDANAETVMKFALARTSDLLGEV